MKLSTGRSVWLLDQPEPASAYPDLAGDERCDVAVIGAGISGALAARELVNAGLQVLILDPRPVGLGSTIASTALVQYEIDVPLVELRQRLGNEAADAAYLGCVRAVRRLGKIAGELGDRCGYEPRTSLYLASTADDVATLRVELAARQEIGIDVAWLSAADIAARYPFARPAALRSAVAAQVDPYCLTRRLIAAAAHAGARVRTGTGARVERFASGPDGVTLEAAGGTIRTRHAVFATGYESQSYLDSPVATLKSTYAMATAPHSSLPGWTDRALIWETARPYLYLRTTADGRVIVGGEDEDVVDPAARDTMLGAKVAVLEERAGRLFPEIDMSAACAWAGTFAETPDGLPYVGMPEQHPGAWFVLGYGGNGITFSVIAAEIVREGCLGRTHPDAALYAFGRAMRERS